jgi:flagellar biogenesis protein FliO
MGFMPLKITNHTHAADPANYGRFLLALIIVAGLLFAMRWVLQWFAERQGMAAPQQKTAQPLVQIVAQQALDLKRRLVVTRWRDREFLLLLSPDAAVVVAENTVDTTTPTS